MDETTKNDILVAFKRWFREELAIAHKNNTLKLASVDEFTINPFLWSYLAYFLEGKGGSETLAKVLLYPRMLGSSINTSFGMRSQTFITGYFGETFGSPIPGIDIEFIDKLDGRKKYCQLKAGPNVINHDDVDTIKKHFGTAMRTARQNSLPIQVGDFMFCLLYGEEHQKSSFVQKIAEDYPVMMGKEFWHRFTGDPGFYADLITATAEVAVDFDAHDMVETVVAELAKDIEKTYPDVIDKQRN